MSTDNPFTRQREQEIQLHASQPIEEKLITCSFTIYESDFERVKDMAGQLNQYSRKKINNSLVVRIAINYLEAALQQKNTDFEAALESMIKDAV